MRILFQGDSITDAGRDRSDYHNLGRGYPKFAAMMLRAKMPAADFEFINTGVSADTTERLICRWQTDCVEIAPDVMSILIGINDTWHHAFCEGGPEWISNEEFESNYRRLIEDAKKCNPDMKLILMEQFLLPTTDKEFFREDLDPKIQITRKLAKEYADAFIPLDGLLAARSVNIEDKASMSDCGDGVHPSESTAEYIGGLWADAVYGLIK